MELFQILDCSSLGTCCKDYSIMGVLQVTKVIFGLIQFVVPIILIVAGTIQFLQLTINPELKDGFRRVLNKFMAAVIIFLLPTLVDAFLSATSENFSISACWSQVKVNSTNTNSNNSKFSGGGGGYISTDDDDSIFMDPDEFDKLSGEKFADIDNTVSTPTKKISSKQTAIVSYAKKFLNKGYKYKYKGTWDCTGSYKPTDCSGFVKCVIKNTTGASIPRKANNMWLKRAQYFDVIKEKDIQPGDIIYYGGTGHVGIYTGKGKEIIHNKGTGYGIVKDSNYNKASKHGKPVGFLRVKGVKE